MASPPGSEQERLEYMLNSKRRALILSLRWANTHTYLLQEEPAAISFLEVNMRRIFLQVLVSKTWCLTLRKLLSYSMYQLLCLKL
ncbi:hypothetical protein XENOCAPTIV_015913 [Xenoophorus captivus]|uniref:Uncharacterized protein n=1 Tax=Xenoophorus captivus TaxID=1517983 RepID=A0ABV0RUY4_9TELE